METTDLVVLTVAGAIEFFVGITLNMNILLVYIRNLRNGLSLGPSDRVHLTKALVNTSMHMIMAGQYTIYAFWPQLFLTDEVFVWNTMINMFLTFYNYWLMAVLCVYYCTNITNYGHRCFVWLKRSLSSYLLHILLASGLGSIAISCPIFWLGNVDPPGNYTYHSLIIQASKYQNVTYRTALTILGSFFPFTIAFVSTTVTSWSLISHIWKMKQNTQGFTSSKFQTQISAIRTMVLFLLIFLIYNVMQMLFFTLLPSALDAIVLMFWFVIASYPISEAIIIIQSSSKLRSALLVKFCDRNRRNDEVET